MKVFIIRYFPDGPDKNYCMIESVWDTFDKAQAAITEHARMAGQPEVLYFIVERELNVLAVKFKL